MYARACVWYVARVCVRALACIYGYVCARVYVCVRVCVCVYVRDSRMYFLDYINISCHN